MRLAATDAGASSRFSERKKQQRRVVYCDRMQVSLTERPRDPVDTHVGKRIRVRRRVLGLRQVDLADALGLTSQQIEKYESGANRVSASKLYAIAVKLNTPVSYFFEGLADPSALGNAAQASDALGRPTVQFLSGTDGTMLVAVFSGLTDIRIRRLCRDFVQSLSDQNAAEHLGAAP